MFQIQGVTNSILKISINRQWMVSRRKSTRTRETWLVFLCKVIKIGSSWALTMDGSLKKNSIFNRDKRVFQNVS